MHMYNKENSFFGGHCIGGAQVLFETGLSDPVTTYRNRNENRNATTFDTEKRIQKEIQKEVLKAKEYDVPEADAVVEDIFAKSLMPGDLTYPPFIRMPDMTK